MRHSWFSCSPIDKITSAEQVRIGVDAKVVQELMRHASFRTTMDSYTQALDEPKRQAQKRLADLIMQSGKVGHA